jgi:ABC-2 type transport system permease protein/ribosome-dependent ATPase
MNLRRVAAVALKEGREIVRDRIYFTLAFMLPLALMFIFGYGMSQDVEHVPFAVLDEDRTPLSRDYLHHFIDSRYFAFRGYLRDPREADRLLADGTVRLVIVIPDQFQQRLLEGGSTSVQTFLDGTFTISIRTVRGYLEAINSAASGDLLVGTLARRLGVSPERAQVLLQPARIEVRYLYNQELRNAWTTAPMLLMVILTWTTPLLMALSVVREKETGSIYNVYAATITRAEFLAGKFLPTGLIGLLNAGLLWLVATAYFGAPFRGSLPLFALASALYVLAVSSLGLLISLAVRTQQAAQMLAVIVGTMVATQYSGMNTPVADMTGANYVIAHIFPAMYYTTIVEGSFLKGARLAQLWPELLALTLYAAAGLWVGHWRFRKRVRA